MFKDNLVCLWHGIWVAGAAAHKSSWLGHSPKGQQEGRAPIHLCCVPLDLKAVFTVGASRRKIKRHHGDFLSLWSGRELSGWGFLKLNLASLAYTYLLSESANPFLGWKPTCRSSHRMSQVPLPHQVCLLGALGCLNVNMHTHAHMCMWTQHTHSYFPSCFHNKERKDVQARVSMLCLCVIMLIPSRTWTNVDKLPRRH